MRVVTGEDETTQEGVEVEAVEVTEEPQEDSAPADRSRRKSEKGGGASSRAASGSPLPTYKLEDGDMIVVDLNGDRWLLKGTQAGRPALGILRD